MSNSIDFMTVTGNSMILSVTDQEVGESGDYAIVKIRVLSESKWQTMIKQILLSSVENEEFGCTVRKEFYLNQDSKPAYVWSLVLWGDLNAALESLAPILSKRGAPPAPPKSLNVSVPVSQTFVPSSTRTREGSIVKEVMLPATHPGTKIQNKEQTIKVGEPRTSRAARAFASSVTG